MISVGFAEPNLARSVWKLLRLQALITYNNIRRARLLSKIGYAFLALLIVGVLVGVFAASWAFLGLINSPRVARYLPGADINGILQNIPVWVLTGAFFGLLLTSFGVLLQTLYLSGDMEFLLSAPVSIRAVFIAKLVEAILPDFGLVCLFSLPLLFGMGAAFGYSLAYYPLVILVLVALALSVTALCSLLVMAVVRLFPARRVAEVLGFAGAIISILCSQSGQLANSLSVSRGQLSTGIASLNRLNTPWSPLSWAARGIMDVAQNQWLPGLGWSALFLGVSAVVFVGALFTAEHLYYSGWSRVQVSPRRRQKAHRIGAETNQAVRSPFGWLTAWLPRPVRGLMVKDLHVLTRDLRNMSQLITPLLFGVIYALALTRPGSTLGRNPASRDIAGVLKEVSVYANVGISLFVSWSLLSRLALASFSHEGRSYWMLKSAPVSPRRLLLAKFLVAYLPPLVLGSAFMIAISLVQRAAFETLAFGLVMIFFSLAGAVGISLTFGVAGVNLNWQNPRRMVTGTWGCLSMVVTTAYMFGIIVLFFGPSIAAGFLGFPPAIGSLVGLAIGISASLACAVLPPLSIVNRIEKIGELP